MNIYMLKIVQHRMTFECSTQENGELLKMTKILKILGLLVGLVWFVGAVAMTFVYEYDRRFECVQNEGWLKGLLWCETDYKSKEQLAVNHMGLFIKGLGWPLHFISSTDNVSKSEGANGKLEKIESIFKECVRDSKSIPATEKNCIIEKAAKLEGKDTPKEAYCQREANTYKFFAEGRDTGATLNVALQALDKMAPEIMQRLSNASGIQLNEKNIMEETKQVMRYVYAHPDKSPKLLSRDQYRACLAQ